MFNDFTYWISVPKSVLSINMSLVDELGSLKNRSIIKHNF